MVSRVVIMRLWQNLHTQCVVRMESMINIQKDKDREIATDCLGHIFTSAIFFGKQGLAFRHNPDEEGSFVQLPQLCAAENPSLITWLNKYQWYTSHQVQNVSTGSDIQGIASPYFVRRESKQFLWHDCRDVSPWPRCVLEDKTKVLSLGR